MDEIITSSHDQLIRLTETELRVLDQADEVVQSAITSGDPRVAFRWGAQMVRTQQIAGLALAKVLHGIHRMWGVFATDDDFEDVASAETGRSIQTIRKYVDLWEYIFCNDRIDPKVRRALMNKPIGGLLLVTAAARHDDLSSDQWEEMANATDKSGMREIVRKARGRATNSDTALVILLERDGTLRCKRGRSGYTSFGHLSLSIEDEVVKDAIERIIFTAGIVRR